MKKTGKKTENWAIVPNAQCVLCGSDKVKTRNETKFFNYGTLENSTELQAEVPVYKCTECDFTYTDREGDELCHAAVCKYLEVLTPIEVRKLRKNTGLTIKEFSKSTGIGQASISRWENSTLIQNKAMDSYLRLLDATLQTNFRRSNRFRLLGKTVKFLFSDQLVERHPYKLMQSISEVIES